MSWSRDDQAAGRRGYHHGNLREALIRAALNLIAEKGPAGFTFADAARSAGVSSAAPYRHFRDRQALLADVARRGFELFEERLSRAWSEGRPDPFLAFENVGMKRILSDDKQPDKVARQMILDNPAMLPTWLQGVTTIDGKNGLAAVKNYLGIKQ